jgi:hypothetical protein
MPTLFRFTFFLYIHTRSLEGGFQRTACLGISRIAVIRLRIAPPALFAMSSSRYSRSPHYFTGFGFRLDYG